MGIRGLTTYIQKRAHLYFEEYELHNSCIVIDGNAIACQLYKWHCKSNDCFGGDYDQYAAVIHNFFQILSDCDVTPYVLFDGGYEARKVATIISRMKNRIKNAQQLNGATEGSISVFPLFLRETFVDIVLKLNIKCVRCDFECDTEIANIARTLNCPVLSYDSDFFIFDVLYIPFSTFEMCTRKKKLQHNKFYTYIRCQIYRVENFLNSYGGMDKRNLPILAVLLGNDYVKRSVFSLFYKHLKIQKCHGDQNEQQKRIKSLIIWLQNETIQSATQKVLSRYKCKRRKLIAEKINTAIKGYNCTDSIYLKYLEISPVCSKNNIEICLDVEELADDSSEDSENSEDKSDSEEDTSSNNEDALNCDKNKWNVDIPTIFLEKFRRCIYPPSFMDIFVQNKYYCVPQVENDALEYSHSASSEIIAAIHSILKTSENNLVCVARSTHRNVKRHLISACDIDLPSLRDIEQMSEMDRRSIFLKVLKIEENFIKNCLNLFPESWHLFILSLKYLIDKSTVTWSILYALILCKIVLSYVDKHVGLCRSRQTLNKKIISFSTPVDEKKQSDDFVNYTITHCLENMNYNDELACLRNLLPYFHLELKMKIRSQLFDRNIVHSMAQFQSCLLHLKYLNSLLNFPFSDFKMSEIFNGTFVYNLATNFMKRSNLDSYVALLLHDAPTVLHSVKCIIEKIKEHEINIKCDKAPRKRKKKRKHAAADVTCYKEDSSGDEMSFDPNNRFSTLMVLAKNC